MKISTEMLKGVLEGIVLQIISEGETYGYEITKNLNDHGFEDVVEGTVYTILMRLEKHQLVTVEKKKSSLGPARKFYQLNDAGQQRLALFWKNWTFLTAQMDQLKEDHHV
ncbi:PadR family transcriptional regulator [Pediococcus parvulus]|uniref:PadR family transcriptional regulator n=1 Tax=Pediococcus parvulus TaxID=54062 RepID=A0AAP5TDE7_9LACO|nr:PadR family transcriptional regulator [Pediococcus parvulus]MDV7693984.1 PadR family transcriptional regulator [Pediococcus parvulus]OAD63403.1 PadR family transcriptional regulator [Pediococcus parvulus]